MYLTKDDIIKAEADNEPTAEDARLKPKPRKHARLWQYYLVWQELVEFRKRHTLRKSSAERGVSNLDDNLEQFIMDYFQLDIHVKPTTKAQREISFFQRMVEEGQKVGPIWDWCLSHKGIGESMAAQILAQIDNIENFDTIAKLWRYAGYGIFEYWVDEKGKAVCPKEGWKWVEVTVKGKKESFRVWTVVDGYGKNVTHASNAQSSNNGQAGDVIQYTSANNVQDFDVAQHKYAIPQNKNLDPFPRVDYLDPDPTWKLVKLSDRLCEHYHSPFNRTLKAILWNLMESFVKQQTPGFVDLYYSEKKRLREIHPERIKVNGRVKYNDGHIDGMAKRKVKKEFLKQLWLNWRECEGLPISEEW